MGIFNLNRKTLIALLVLAALMVTLIILYWVPGLLWNASNNQITIGVLVMKNDVLTPSLLAGVNLATDEWNANAQNKIKIKLAQMEHTADANDIKNTFNTMVTQYKPAAIIGSPYSSVVVPMVSEIEAANIPYFTGATTAQVTQNNLNGCIFRIQTPDDVMVSVVMDYFVNVYKNKKIAILYDNSYYGQGAKDAAVKNASTLGVSIVASLPIGSDIANIRSQLSAINRSGADISILWVTSAEGLMVLKAMKSTGLSMPFIGSEGFAPVGANSVLPSCANSSYVAVDYLPKTVDIGWVSRVESKYGPNSANFITAGYYDAANLLYQAISKINGNVSIMLKPELHNAAYSGIVGNYSFDQYGNGLKQAYIGYIVNGQIEFLKLETLN